MAATLRRRLIVLASCVFLAWSLQRLFYPLPVAASSEHEYIVTAPAQPVRNPASEGDDVWLLAVVVDGRAVALTDLERTGSWKDEDFALVHWRDGEPATIRIRGHQVTLSFLTSKYSGIIRVAGETHGLDVDLYHPDRPETESTFVVLDLAGGSVFERGRNGQQNHGRTAWMLAVVLLAGVFWRPWRSASALETWVVGHVAVLHACVWLTQGVGYNEDARGYAQGFAEFIAGRVAYYPPGYPVLIGPLGLLFPGATGLALTAVQHVLMVLALRALARMTRACLGDDLAILGLLVAGSAGPTLLLPQVVFSENPAFVGMAGTLWFAFRRSEERGARAAVAGSGDEDPPDAPVRFDVVAGLLAGWAALARVSPLPSVVLPVFLIQAYGTSSWPMLITRTARVLLTAVVVVGVSAAWLYVGSGSFAIANSSGLHLYSRVVTEQLLIDREGPATRRFLSIVGDRPLKGVGHWDISALLLRDGLDYDQTVALMGDVAIEGAKSRPLELIRYSLGMAWREYAASPLPDVPRWASGAVPARQFENPPLLGIHGSSLLWRSDLDLAFAALWPYLLWMPLAGLAFLPWLRGRLVFVVLLTVVTGYLLAASFADVFVQRYAICVIPFALVLTPVPLAGLAAMWGSVRGGRSGSWREPRP